MTQLPMCLIKHYNKNSLEQFKVHSPMQGILSLTIDGGE